MSEIAIGIDLGTSTSEVTVFINGETKTLRDPLTRSPIIPSVVALDQQNRIVVGNEAMKYIGIENHCIQEVKRLMGTDESQLLGDKYLRPEEISAIILKSLKEMVEFNYSVKVSEAVITVPANFPEPSRKATFDAAELADLKVLRLINEPTAAALAYGIKKLDLNEQLLVFDWGGGTLDITVMEMKAGNMDVIASYGDLYLGGKDFDEILAEKIADKFEALHPYAETIAFEALKNEARKAKEILSIKEEAEIYVPAFAVDQNGNNIKLQTTLTRLEFERIVTPLLKKARDVVKETMGIKGVSASSINKVLAIGGTTYIPAVRKMLNHMFMGKVLYDIDPDLAVSTGAAIQAAAQMNLLDESQKITTTDISPYGLGVEVADLIMSRWFFMYDPLIEPNTKLPFSKSVEYDLIDSKQKAVTVKVLQSHLSGRMTVDDAIDTGIRGRITKIPLSKDGTPHTIRIDFMYDANGMINLSAIIPATGQKIVIDFTDSEVTMNEEEKIRAKANLNTMFKASK